MTAQIPTEEEVIGYFDTLSNWGRWGEDDQKGTLNLVTPEKRLQALGLVREGETVSCASDINFEWAPDTPNPPIHFMVESGEGWSSGQKVSQGGPQVAMDFIGMNIHGGQVTHLDSFAHFFWKGQGYNGKPAHLISTGMGATVHSVTQASDGIVTKGVLVDVPLLKGIDWMERGTGVMPEDILEAEERFGFKVEPGDALLVRTGQFRRRNEEGPVDFRKVGGTACHAACLPLFRERDIALIGTDTTNDVSPTDYPSVPQPIHLVGLVALGLWIVDRANFEELAETCQRLGRWEFMLNVSPLRLHNATGSPVNPIAVF